MAQEVHSSHKDPYLLECCLPNKSQPYIGVDISCDKNAIFCINHNCHINSEGLMHQMMPLKEFKRKIDQRRFLMEKKVGDLMQQFSNFMDKLIAQIRQIKLRKCLQLSMLWLRDLASSEDEYELMRKIYRMDFEGITCKQIHEVYFKIIHNEQLFMKDIDQIDCYKGISKVLDDLGNKTKAIQMLADKVTQIEGVLTNGQILKKLLPDKKIRDEKMKEVLLEQLSQQEFYEINYNKAKLSKSSNNFKCIFSKYPISPHTTYQISIKTKYSNVMLGICECKLKQEAQFNNLHHNERAIVFNCANGNTYKDGMFISGSNTGIKNLNELNIKLRLTNNEVFLTTNKQVLMRANLQKLTGPLYLILESRTEQDAFEVYCDAEISPDNLKVLAIIKEQQQIPSQSNLEQLDNSLKMYEHYELSKNEINSFNKLDSNISLGKNQQQETPSNNHYPVRRQLQLEAQDRILLPPKLSSQILQIKSKVKDNLIPSIKVQMSNPHIESETKNKQWEEQKNKYINQIKERIKLQGADKQESKRAQNMRKTEKLVKPTYYNHNYRREDQGKIVSEVKVSVSDSSDFTSMAKLTMANNIMMNKLRRGSDNIKIDNDKIIGIEEMVQSIQPRTSPRLFQHPKIGTIKTPPKINFHDVERRSEMSNQSQYI